MPGKPWFSVAAVCLVLGAACSAAPVGGPVGASNGPSLSPTDRPTTPASTIAPDETDTPDPTAVPTSTSAPPKPEPPVPTAASSGEPLPAQQRVMSLQIENSSSAGIGGEVIGSGHMVDNVFKGDLVQQADDTWKGPATATSKGSNAVFFLTERCNWTWEGQQRLELTAEEGSFADGNNFRIMFVPTTNPTFTEPPLCDFVPDELNGVRYLPFFDDHITDGGWVELKIADPPGGTAVHEDDLDQFASFNWTTTVEYLEPTL